MYITVHLSDGRKITKDPMKLNFITDIEKMQEGAMLIEDGKITINWLHVVDMRIVYDDDIEHAKIHGW